MSTTRRSELTNQTPREQRDALVADASVRGAAFGRAYAVLVDQWLASLLPDERDLAIVAVGGYGRQALAPGSDLDLLLVHERKRGIGELADQVWYPIWDAGFSLDHSVRTVGEALAMAKDDVKVALGLVDARTVAGDTVLGARLVTSAAKQWPAIARKSIDSLRDLVVVRNDRFGQVAFVLEPDLKEGRGGLRDATVLRSLAAAFPIELSPEVDAAVETLFATRVELQRSTGRRDERLLLEQQDDVAVRSGFADADALMHRIAECGRTISWNLDDAWRVAEAAAAGPRRRSWGGRDVQVSEWVVERDGEITVLDACPWVDVALTLAVAAASADRRRGIARSTLRRLAAEVRPQRTTWSEATRASLVGLLATGHDAVPVFETLDQHDLMARILPEWAPNRSRPQRNAFHRFTVDRHLVEAAAQAAVLTDRVDRPDLLLIGAWLHDLGKGYPGDHTDVGIGLMRTVANRMGYDPDDVETLVALVRYHLLLPSVATSRDLDDDATIASVATTVTSVELLELLHALTEADSIATGPSAWNAWKAGLVETLVERVRARLSGIPHVHGPSMPEADAALEARAAGGLLVEGGATHLVVIAPDTPGLFSRVVGLLALGGHDVRAARARSNEGVAISEYDLEPSRGELPDWAAFEVSLQRALEDDAALDPALADRARRYGELQRPRAARLAPPKLIVDNEASAAATVLEVHAPDEPGVLHRIARVLAELGLDIRHAKVSTLGPEVVDTFYIATGNGQKVVDEDELARVETAILAAVAGAHPGDG